MEGLLRTYEHSVKLVIGIAVATFTLWQYFEYKQDQRIERSLEFYSSVTEGKLQESADAVESFWYRNWDTLLESVETHEDREKLETWRENVVLSLDKQGLIVASIRLIDFYTSLQICIENRLCDRDTAKALLGKHAKNFLENNCALIAELRHKWADDGYADRALAFSEDNRCDPEIYRNDVRES